MILDTIAGSKYSQAAGDAGTVTVPAGLFVVSIRAHATTAGTLVIAPKGPGQSSAAQASIPLPASADWFELDMLGQLGAGSTLVFGGTDSYLVTFASFSAGV